MSKLVELETLLSKGKQESNFVKRLYLLMEKVGGYEQLMNLSLPALAELLKCMEWEFKEKEKQTRRRR